MSMTTDQPVTNFEDRPTELPPHLDPPNRSRPARPLRVVVGSIVSITAIGAAVLLAVMGEGDDTGRSDNRGVVAERGDAQDGDSPPSDARPNPPTAAPAENGPTELDVRGIPTWWTGAGALEHDAATDRLAALGDAQHLARAAVDGAAEQGRAPARHRRAG